MSNNNLMESVDFIDALEVEQEAQYLQVEETPKE